MYVVLRATNCKGKSIASNIGIWKFGRETWALFLGELETQCLVRALAKGKVDCKGNMD